ncbi:fimbrillin family protein, partial [Bacteroides sp. OttesenSCG-928-J23]|nr:fimbrillin family protein [Bacteroides sp. OttesenSCG-928-J23]MDL2305643.1 fimbrillin family protein [Bacteroides sp. OttesenSCG-928-D19]
MKKKLSTFNYQLSTLLAAIALAGCQAEHTDIIIDNDAPIAFNIAIGGVDTRVATNDLLKSNWENGDAIGIFVHKGGSPHASNVKLTYNNGTWSAASPIYYAPSTDAGTYTFYAYYPYVANLTSINTTIPIDALNVPTHHLAATKTGVARGTTNVALTFNHLLTLVQVDFDATQCYISPNLAVTLKGCCPTATYTLASPTPTIGTGTPAPIPMTRVGNTNTYRAMVPPQTIQQGTRMFTIQNDDLFQSQPLANDMTLSKGKAELFPQITKYSDYAPLITDGGLRSYCLGLFDSDGDGKLSYTEVMAATEIEVFNQMIT